MRRPRRNRAKGIRIERELTKILKEYGWKSRRLPASVIDGIATRGERIVLFEVKATRGDHVTIPKRQVERLFEWLDLFDHYRTREAVAAIRFTKHRKWVFILLREIKDYKITYHHDNTWYPS